MSTMTRTDIHRPSAVEFDPENYMVRDFADFHPEEGHRPVQTVSRLVDEGYSFHGAPHGSGQCSHCGTRLRYAALMSHEPTKTLLYIGETCLGTRFEGTKAEFDTMRAEAAAKAEKSRREGKSAEFFAQYPDMIFLTYAHNIEVAGGEVIYLDVNYNEFATSEEAAASTGERFGSQWYTSHKRGTTWAEKTRMAKWTSVLNDMGHKVTRYGSLSDAQVSFARKILVWLEEAEARRVEQAAKAQAKVDAGVVAPEGRVEITGTVTTTKWIDNDFGGSLKMRVESPEGWAVWGTVPSSIEVEKGDTVTFTAKVTRSNDDPTFGFYSRPTKARKG